MALPTAELIEGVYDNEIPPDVLRGLKQHENGRTPLVRVFPMESSCAVCRPHFASGCISLLLFTSSFPPGGADLRATVVAASGQGNPAIALSLLPLRPLPPQSCPSSGAGPSHLGYWVSLLRVPRPQLSSSRASISPHERDFIKQGCDHILYLILS